MSDVIKYLEPSPGAAEMLELTQRCQDDIRRTFAIPDEYLRPARSRPITIDLAPFYQKVTELLGCKFTVDPGLPDDTMIVQTGKETKVFRIK